MNIVFMGTPDFAVPSLEKIIEKHNVIGVFTQPDKPKGRGKKLGISAVKEVALKHNIPIYQPVKLRNDKEMIEKLKELKPDFIIVVAFGQILTKEVLDIPSHGCINLHGSILPMYRGSAPIQWAVINGEKVSGNTTIMMDEGIDTGDMLLMDMVEITENMTSGELFDILKDRGADLLLDTIEGVSKKIIMRVKQEGETFYAKMLDKNLGEINWNNTAKDIHNLIRGLNPWPIAFTTYNEERMKIFESEVLDEETSKAPGVILEVSKLGMKVATKEGVLLIKKIQMPNGKPLTIQQYTNGHTISIGDSLI